MQNLILNKKFLLFLAILSIGTLLFSLFFSQKTRLGLPQLVYSTPTTNSLGADVFNPVMIQFDKPILVKDFTIISSPEESWDLAQEGQNSLRISHSLALRPSTKYQLVLSWKSSPLPALTFTTQSSQGDPRLVQTLTQELNRDYPLAKLTPYNTPLYRVVYSAPMTLEITIKNRGISSQKATEEVRSWVTSVGGDATTHKYIISNQSLPSSPTINNLQSPLTPFSTGTP